MTTLFKEEQPNWAF